MTRAGERAGASRPARPAHLATLLAALLSACAGGPSSRGTPTALPVIPIPDRYSEAPPAPSATEPAPPAAGPEWWHALGSSELDGLVERGLANNTDVRMAMQHIVQAKARYEQARAGRMPVLTAPLLVGDQSLGAGSVGAAPTGSANGGTGGGSQKTWQASVRADWQIDLWGEQSALARSAQFQLQRALHERENVARNLAAAIAGSYVDYLTANDRRRIARSTEELQGATLTVIEDRVKAGDATVADLEQQRAAIFSIRATLPVLEQQRQDALANLAELAGTVPGRLTLSDRGLEVLHAPAVVTGLPSQLLLQRPDVRMAEAQLRAANADVAVARARLLPPMDLSAQIGRSAGSPAQLLLPQTLFWSVVDSLTVSLFDGGRRQGEENFSRAVEEEMVEGYVRAIHGAVREVESALTTLRLSGERLAAEQQTLEAARRAMDISARIYKAGGVDYLTLLDTQRTYHRYLDDFQQVRASQFHAHIALLQALGGGLQLPAASADAKAGTTDAGKLGTQCLAGLPGDDGQPAGGGDWQVELFGTYHCATVAPAWHDLQRRYPKAMQARVLRPTLTGHVEGLDDGDQSWYRLAVSRFATREQAQDFCANLQSDQQRCEVSATPLAHPLGSAAASAATPKAGASAEAPARKSTTAAAAAQKAGSAAHGSAPGSGMGASALASVPTALGTDGTWKAADGSVAGLEITSLLAAADQASVTAASDDGAAIDGSAANDAVPGGSAPDSPGAGRPAAVRGRPPASPASATARATSGRFLQLGAFRDAARAESLRARAADSLRDLSATVALRKEGELHLVWAGPFGDPQSERTASSRLRELIGQSPRSVRLPLTAGAP